MIECKNLGKNFGRVKAVNGLDLAIDRGETLTIFGPNGAGKTTLLRMMAGLVRPTVGAVIIDGAPVEDKGDQTKKKIGYISHQSLVYDRLTARENLMFFSKLYGVMEPERKAKSLLDKVGLASRADDLAQTFSRGMKQRLSIARALVCDPEIALLDEPFTGLDQHAAEMLKNTVAQLTDSEKIIVMITHNLEVGLDISTRVAAMVAGSIKLDMPTNGLSVGALREVYFKTVGEAHY